VSKREGRRVDVVVRFFFEPVNNTVVVIILHVN
jgi:hypothetical protein